MTDPDPIADDADKTIAWWRAWGDLTPNHVWLELTGERRRYCTWSEVKGFITRWEHRRIAREQQPQPYRRAA